MPRRKYREIVCTICGLSYSLDDYEFCPYCASRDVTPEDIIENEDQDDIIGENWNEL